LSLTFISNNNEKLV